MNDSSKIFPDTPNSRAINGPVNVMRVEGKVGDIDKVLYVFFDYHFNVFDQSQCSTIFSTDIDKFLPVEFKKLDKKIDFFMEINLQAVKIFQGKTNPIQITEKDRLKYIWQVMKMFGKVFDFDFEQNKIIESNVFKNVRLHYIDIREHFGRNFFRLQDEIYGFAIYNFKADGVHKEFLMQIINAMTEFNNLAREQVDVIIQFLQGKNEKVTKIIYSQDETKEETELIYYLLDKVLNQYNNDDVKKKLHKFVKKNIHNFENAIEISENIIEMTKTLINKIENGDNHRLYMNYDVGYYIIGYPSADKWRDLLDIQIELNYLSIKIMNIFVDFVDVYFLRRFLDKEYITNGVSYTGAYHSSQYIFWLVKYFGFKITHAYYPNMSNLTDLNETIKKEKDFSKFEVMFVPHGKIQCSNMSDFPANFT